MVTVLFVTLSLTINETLKMAPIAAHLNAGIILVVKNVVLYNLPLPLPPYPLSPPRHPSPPSLISFMVSVDVKHHIYLLYWNHRVRMYQLHSDDIFNTVQHFVTKVNLVMHHHESERHARKQSWVAGLHGQGHSEGSQ